MVRFLLDLNLQRWLDLTWLNAYPEMPHLENVTETNPALAFEHGLPEQAVDAGAG
jgi:hypothetical protein